MPFTASGGGLLAAAPSSISSGTARSTPQPQAPSTRTRSGTTTHMHSNGFANTNGPNMSSRKAPPLDLSTVERRTNSAAARDPPRRVRPHGITEAPTYRPTAEEFKDPIKYIQQIAPEGRKYGIVKIIPPDNWNPDFKVDTERFHFRTRKQELNSCEGGTRSNLNYLDALSKFHKQHGMNLNRFPSVDKRPLDLYRLKKAVEIRGGFERVCKFKKWAEIGRDLGYSGKIMSSLSTSLKNSYQRWLYPYEEYLRVAKPDMVRQHLENGYKGITPSPSSSPMKQKSQPNTPSNKGDSPAIKSASAALNGSIKEDVDTPMRDTPPAETPVKASPAKPSSGGFTAVNSGGFTAVNVNRGFAAVNGIKKETNGSTPPPRKLDDPLKTASERASPFAVGHTNGLKRQLSQDSLDQRSNGSHKENVDANDEEGGRRSKRLKKDAPTVVGSNMVQHRAENPRPMKKHSGKPGECCEICGKNGSKDLQICDGCDNGFHVGCLDTPPRVASDGEWHCKRCLVGISSNDFGFEDGAVYSLRQFQEKANNFKDNYFSTKMPFDPILNKKKTVSEDDVEREFWRLVESITETVEVEYGADIHSTTHGSGFPTIEKNPLDKYSTDPWNLNMLPLHQDSLFRHIKSDISGMTVPWLYVGMCFSTFCWHNEDHYTYSANYQHFGATKTWYGIPGEDADKFEEAMRAAVPDLFEQQPDLLFQLVTLLPPDQLKKAGVNVYALDQRAGQFVITFPQAYHAGFNHGFNFNEAVNFAPSDWEPFGQSGVERLQEYHKQPCFSHDELLMTAALRDTTIKTARWLAPALERNLSREFDVRRQFVETIRAEAGVEIIQSSDIEFPLPEVMAKDPPEEEYACAFCKAYCYLSHVRCEKSGTSYCLPHATANCCGEESCAGQHALSSPHHRYRTRYDDAYLQSTISKLQDKAHVPQAWAEKLSRTLDESSKPSLKVLRTLAAEGERMPFELAELPSLRAFVDRCNNWVEEATYYITRKQQNRRKNEKAWRRGSTKAPELEERDKELRNPENIVRLLREAEEISFDSPEIGQLQERAEAVADFRDKAQKALLNPGSISSEAYEELVETGKSFNVDVPEAEELDRVVHQMKWFEKARDMRTKGLTLKDVSELVAEAAELNVPDNNEQVLYFAEQKRSGEIWESKAKELMAAETVHFQQLEALSNQASTLPVCQETLGQMEQILNKQREVHKQIISLYQRSRNEDPSKRPRYKDVREVMDPLAELHSKPTGTIDLEKLQKQHEDWMRRGKKLFGKANAPLHILLAHMSYVDGRNRACFSLEDKPRTPVEPSSREQSPVDNNETADSPKRVREAYCLCRQAEAGMMIECELCREWYHGKCLKIARGKVKEDEKYTCPICDWRVKIPRDAARPKLEDLMDWQAEIAMLPFVPDEEEVLDSIISTALLFRKVIKPIMNPIMSSADEVSIMRFYLRKVEGAEVLLTDETNFLRQEIHKWFPVAPQPPPMLEQSLSTRKPRPTKQQKLMAQLGIENPEDLPPNLRSKQVKPKSENGGSRNGSAKPAHLQPKRSTTPGSQSSGPPSAGQKLLSHDGHSPTLSQPTFDYSEVPFSNPTLMSTSGDLVDMITKTYSSQPFLPHSALHSTTLTGTSGSQLDGGLFGSDDMFSTTGAGSLAFSTSMDVDEPTLPTSSAPLVDVDNMFNDLVHHSSDDIEDSAMPPLVEELVREEAARQEQSIVAEALEEQARSLHHSDSDSDLVMAAADEFLA